MRSALSIASVALLIAVAPHAPAADREFYRGMTVSCQTWGTEWETPQMATTLAELHGLGVNSIAIHPYARIEQDGHLHFRQRSGSTYITTPLHWAHQLGMSTMLIPHIAYWGTRFSWRGEIDFTSAQEWDRFFSDYEVWIEQMAQLAESEHSELFCVGLELAHAERFDQRWRNIIAAVRKIYHGKITYGANWDRYEAVKFWDAVDYIGVLAYFPLTDSPDPSRTQLDVAWRQRGAELARFSRRNGGKQVLFTEIGYNESSRAAAEPWTFQTGGDHAAEIQLRCIESALAASENSPWLAGMFWWKWFPELPHDEEENYRLQTPAIKSLIARYWQPQAASAR